MSDGNIVIEAEVTEKERFTAAFGKKRGKG